MWFKKKIEVPSEIIDFNVFPPEKEKLLCIGAAVSRFAEAKRAIQPNYLKLYFPEKYKKNIVKYWLPMFGISTGENAKALIESWISENSYAAVVSEGTKGKVQKEIQKAARKQETDVQVLMSASEKISDSGAFDLERLGYIIRVCFTLDLIKEQDAWRYLEILYKLAQEHYENWEEYIVSYSNENEAMNTSWYKDIIIDYLAIKQGKENIFDKYPLK
ncbi:MULTISPECIES: DUF1266 domain-containing protein [unclassified Enterococcus]|uniref:DUF1266 domain-containing protein n=1 Tax=unclassified Enterococcus TaxID=2608891 RepID=UPI001CE21802|nr:MULTISPECIES: DUF1266 domain-containing protein [unclassified Enterococcus]MCA5012564.1 DUF1266 domain-containing protein [Enterococcus sp. S23]MCA5015815.1 DUF1266 domain-containing protein [Enterococcus sp. S22(2020)]